jgi:hypothetical protein
VSGGWGVSALFALLGTRQHSSSTVHRQCGLGVVGLGMCVEGGGSCRVLRRGLYVRKLCAACGLYMLATLCGCEISFCAEAAHD